MSPVMGVGKSLALMPQRRFSIKYGNARPENEAFLTSSSIDFEIVVCVSQLNAFLRVG